MGKQDSHIILGDLSREGRPPEDGNLRRAEPLFSPINSIIFNKTKAFGRLKPRGNIDMP